MNHTYAMGQIQALPVTAERIATVTRQDNVLSHALKFSVREGWPLDVSKEYDPSCVCEKET